MPHNVAMPVQIASGLTDDNDFVTLVGRAVHALVAERTPDQFWIIQVDNWFDHKWLKFSGNGIIANWMFAGAFDSIASRFDSVKKPFFQANTTFPPFSPRRVVGQWSFVRAGGDYLESPLPFIPHAMDKTQSEANLHRYIHDLSNSAFFIWYSANTLKNGRGSLMVYDICGSCANCWYASFNRSPDWELVQTKGTNRENLLKIMSMH
ncbi:MAG: hypothetical protein WBF42_16025 [Terracidiphilus sp.]